MTASCDNRGEHDSNSRGTFDDDPMPPPALAAGLLTVFTDSIHFFQLCVRSRTALAAANLFRHFGQRHAALDFADHRGCLAVRCTSSPRVLVSTHESGSRLSGRMSCRVASAGCGYVKLWPRRWMRKSHAKIVTRRSQVSQRVSWPTIGLSPTT